MRGAAKAAPLVFWPGDALERGGKAIFISDTQVPRGD
jgi:hypothetical protein